MYRRASLAISLVALFAACSTAPNAADGFSVVTTVSPAQFRAGDQVSVHVVVRNISYETRTIAGNNCPYAFVVVGADGSIVGPGDQICTAQMETVHLPPQGEYSWTQTWTGGARTTSPQLLPPGTYVVRGRLMDGGSRNAGATVTITP